MLWIAFAHASSAKHPPPELMPPEADLQALCWWALGFSPRVCLIDEAVLMEVSASTRLFGGQRALLLRLRDEAHAQGVQALSCTPTALSALALLRHLTNRHNAQQKTPLTASCKPQTLATTLDTLDINTLTATHPHTDTLRSLGCDTLGALRALPRGGVARRFGGQLLTALDQAYGLQTASYDWVTLPAQFDETMECPAAVEVGTGLLFGVQRLLQRLKTWLQTRQLGVSALRVHWRHDTLRRHEIADGGITLRTSTPTNDVAHLFQLAAEHLARTTLAAPVRQLRVQAIEVQALPGHNRSLLPDPREQGETLAHMSERVAARLGSQRVQRPLPTANHLPEHMVQWRAAHEQTGKAHRPASWPTALALQPPWLLPVPLRLAVQQSSPQYHGQLTILAGPHRVETGWWLSNQAPGIRPLRDYYLAESPQAGLLWIFRERGSREPSWYLHGVYG